MSKSTLLPLTLLIAMALAACQAPIVVSPTEMSLPPTELPAPAAVDALTLTVETAEVITGVGSPIPVDIAITGRLPDTCAQIGSIEQMVEGFNIRIAVKTFTPALNDCIIDSVPFRVAIPLNTISLPAGTYTIIVNDSVITTFTMPIEAGTASTGLRPIPVSHVTVEVGVGSPIPVDAFVSGEWPESTVYSSEKAEGEGMGGFRVSISIMHCCPSLKGGLKDST